MIIEHRIGVWIGVWIMKPTVGTSRSCTTLRNSSGVAGVWGFSVLSVSNSELEFVDAMAAASVSMAVASTRFAVVAARSESALSRNGTSLSMAAPLPASASMSCVFSEFARSSKRSGKNGAVVVRAAEIFDLAVEEAAEAASSDPVPAPVVEDPVPAPVMEDPVPAPVVEEGLKLYVGNLPWDVDSAQLAGICEEFGTVEEVEVIYDQETGRSRGFAFVTMASNEDARSVIDKLNGTDMGGRVVRVNYPQPRGDRPRFERGERPFGGERRREENMNKLYVGNLTWGCDDGALHDLFSDYGNVVEAKVVYDRDSGRSRGFGFVTLENASDVNAAMEKLDGSDYGGRQLRVNLAGDKPPRREF